MKCKACNFPKDPPDWHDYECPICRCPQKFWLEVKKPWYIPRCIYEWYWWKYKWPTLRNAYLDSIWWKRNLIYNRVQEIL